MSVIPKILAMPQHNNWSTEVVADHLVSSHYSPQPPDHLTST
jgi:hypothetical protein